MTVPWAAEHVVDAELASALVGARFPSLRGAAVEPIGAGWDNTAYLVGGEWVFRFPRREVAVPLLEREIVLLPRIAPALPLPVPVPELVGRPAGGFPWPFAGYRALGGSTACSRDLDDAARARAAAPLGAFLAALHAFPAAEAESLGAPPDDLRRADVPYRSAKAAVALDDLAASGAIGPGCRRDLERVLAATPAPSPRSPVVSHGDLYARHLLVDAAGAPSGIIDWGDLHLGHPAIDLAIAWSFLPPASRQAFREAYGAIDEATWALARFRAVYHAASVARFARDEGDARLFAEALRCLAWV